MNAEWDKNYGKTTAKSILQIDDDGYIILISDTDYAWITRTNLKGEMQWQRKLTGDSVSSGTKTNDDGYILAGGYWNRVGWLTKADENGNEKWHKTLSVSSII